VGCAVWVAGLLAATGFFAAPECAASGAQSTVAGHCGVDFKKPAHRVFADATGKGRWIEYRSVADAAELNLDDGAIARTWAGNDGNTLVRIEEPGEDFWIYTDYCYDKDGELSWAGVEVRTAWGWGFREAGPVKDGEIAAEAKEFFDIVKGTTIPKPDSANDVPEALKPRLYLEMAKLPFAKLLEPEKAK
jgi:hypothetical protein